MRERAGSVDPTYLGEGRREHCLRHDKVLYRRHAEALQAAERLRDPRLSVYPCWAALGFHVGHPRQEGAGHVR